MYCNYNDVMRYYEIVVEPANRATLIGVPKILSLIENRIYRSGQSSLVVLNEKLRTLYIGHVFKHFSPFYEIFDEVVGFLSASGLIDRWLNDELNPRRKKRIYEDIGPQVLTMEHLSIGFTICMIMLVFSAVVFILEVLGGKVYSKFRKIC